VLDAPPENIPVGCHDLTAVNGGASTFELTRPGLVNVRLRDLFETLEYPRSHFCPILFRKIENLGQ
jgi:hypothetical protein